LYPQNVKLSLRILACVVISTCHVTAATIVERGPWSGALTPTSAVVKAKIVLNLPNLRLAVSRNADLSRALFVAAEKSESHIVTFHVRNLEPNQYYYYAVDAGGGMDLEHRGRFRTYPDGPTSFTFAFASCARTASSHPVFETILRNNPLFFMNVGDLHYLDIKENRRDLFRSGYDLVLGSRTQSTLYRYVPFVYMWDDHDFGGNNSNSEADVHEAAQLTYQEYVPHYPLVAGSGNVPVYHAFTVGRVRFILTDLRSARTRITDPDDARKTMLGIAQKQWLKSELLAARGNYPLIFWVSTVPWLGTTGTNYYPIPATHTGYAHHRNLPPLPISQGRVFTQGANRPPPEDHWSLFSTERRELADFVKENSIAGLCIIHGDAHMLAADDGSNADYATGGGAPIPVIAAAPLDQGASIKGGPYSQGIYKPPHGEGCFGLVRVLEQGDRIRVVYSGRNHLNAEKVSLQFEIPAK
jgi:phosphodiesterase/alkaline phosphatase D-like protein